MSTSTSLVKQLLSEQSKANSQSPTGQNEAAASLSYDDVKAAAKEGTAEALSEHSQSAQDDETEPALDAASDGDQSSGGRSLRRVLLLVLVVAYYLQRRRGRGQSTDAQ
jgi:hypothetical protein